MGFKPDVDDQLVSFSALTLLVVIWPVKVVPEMTYNVMSGTLSLTCKWPFGAVEERSGFTGKWVEWL